MTAVRFRDDILRLVAVPLMQQHQLILQQDNAQPQLRNALVDEWNNIPVRTVNALVNSIQRRIKAAAAARGDGGRGTRDIDHCS